jgi:hypothetical protein
MRKSVKEICPATCEEFRLSQRKINNYMLHYNGKALSDGRLFKQKSPWKG